MKLIKKEYCKTSLNFQTIKTWPVNWPPFSWETTQISGFNSSSIYALNFHSYDVNFLHLFHNCYPKLHLMELAQIATKWKNIEPYFFTWSDFFTLYGLHQPPDDLKKQLQKLLSTPLSFQNWLTDKRIHLNELRIFNVFSEINDLDFIFQWLHKNNVSKSNGLTALELAGELRLMGYKEADILPSHIHSVELSIEYMEQKRKKNTLSVDQEKQKYLQQIAWPAHANGRWLRKGDETGLEIKLWCKNQKDMAKKIEQINKVQVFDKLFSSNSSVRK